MDKIFAARNLLRYKLSAKTRHGVHSPFVFDLLSSVILDKTAYYGFEPVESLRAKHLLDNRTITIVDFGTGKNREEKISAIAAKSLKPKKYAQLLFRLVNKFKPASTLELGTSLGITTLYLSLPYSKNSVYTLEGSEEIAKIASANFKRLKRDNIHLLQGEFNETLPSALQTMGIVDFVYIDGNHKELPTLSYFEMCLKHAKQNSVFVFDDIHWSKEMESAWNKIKSHKSVTLSIDLYQFGIIFFRSGMTKEDFILKF